MTTHRACIEFWVVNSEKPVFLARLETAAPPPPEGAFINIAKKNYRVHQVDYSIDYLDRGPQAAFRRNVFLVEQKQ